MKARKLSEEFYDLSVFFHKDQVAIVSLFRKLRGHGQVIIAIFFCVPFLLFLPVPGLSTVFGLIVAVIGIRLALGKDAWLPSRWLRKKIKGETVRKIFGHAGKIALKMERFTKPRMEKLATGAGMNAVNGLVISISGLLLALPYPPGTNFTPALGVVGIAVGILECDGSLLIASYLLFAFNLALFAAITFLGVEGIQKLFHWL